MERREGFAGRAIYIGKSRLFDLKSRETLDGAPMTRMHVDDVSRRAMPVVVVNQTQVRMRMVLMSVFLGNLLTGIVVAIVYSLLRQF